MTRQLDDFLKTFTPAEQAKIQTRARALIEDELTLRALRQAHDLTQERMAEFPERNPVVIKNLSDIALDERRVG